MTNHINIEQSEVTVIGAGLTGLTTAYWLKRLGVRVCVVETDSRIGGQIQTQQYNKYVYETGPTTGAVSTPEVAELMMDLAETSEGKCQIETAPDSSKRRLIWKEDRFRELPSGLLSAVTTPLFRFSDKLRILGEPWRKRGNDPDESVASLAARRLGRSFVDYAVDPFISGVYAGNPDQLVVRYALPKLYALERDYGSFVRGSIAKMKQPKSDRDRLATKKVFSALGGLSNIPEAEADYIGRENIILGTSQVAVGYLYNNKVWETAFVDADGNSRTLQSRWVVTTCGAYNLPQLLPFVDKERMDAISGLVYAPVMEVNVGMPDTFGGDYCAFGGLVPSVERQQILGILFPSACFVRRAPEGGALFSFFLGGIKHPEMLDKSDEEIRSIVTTCLHKMLKFPDEAKPDFIHISRHRRAIPQYGADSGRRFEAVAAIEKDYPGLVIGGNLRDGIGMGHRITQATTIANHIINTINNN
jgi:oxygen-dependent protoporphyrinogen oxidase